MDNLNYWPSTNVHELNLDWIIAKVKELDTRFTDDIETFVREYIDEHFAEWTVNANYDPDDETIIYTNGTGATLTAGDVIRFAIDNAYVNVKDPTARASASAAQTTANNAGTAAAAAQSTADSAASAAAAAQSTADSATTAAAAAQSTADSKADYVNVGDMSAASSINDAVGRAFDAIQITNKTVVGHFGYAGEWMFVAFKYSNGAYGCMIAFRYDGVERLMYDVGGTKTYKILSTTNA